NGRGGWLWNLRGLALVLYNLRAVIAALIIYVVEGEKDADALTSLGVTATCNCMGAGKWRDQYNEHLRGKTVFVIPDNDEPGQKHAAKVIRSLTGVAGSIHRLVLPGAKDAAEWIERGGTLEALTDLSEQARQSPANRHPAPEHLASEADA